jgi:molecular chaperone GrpE
MPEENQPSNAAEAEGAALAEVESEPGPGAEPATDAAEAGRAALEARVAELEAEAKSLKDQLLRTLAEAENSRRRARREAEDTAKYAVTGLAKELLPVPDNLRRALESIPAEGRQGDALLDRLATGVEMVERDINAVLERNGIKRIEPLGQPFDHNFHQAVFEVPTAEHPSGTVVQVLAPGYVIHDRLLRPAMVAVAKAAGGGPPRDAVWGNETGNG